MKQCNFSNYKVGDMAWNIRDGWEEIVEISDGLTYPIRTMSNSYTIDGKYADTDEFPTIYHNEFKIPDEAFVKPLPIDTKVLVWDNGNEKNKRKRYFKEFDNFGNIVCFSSGRTSWSTNGDSDTWDNYEVVENDALCIRKRR